MLLVAQAAYNFVSKGKNLFHDSLTVSYLLPLGFRFRLAAWRGWFFLEAIFLDVVVLHVSPCLMFLSQSLNPKPETLFWTLRIQISRLFFFCAQKCAQRDKMNIFSRPPWFDSLVFSFFLVFFFRIFLNRPAIKSIETNAPQKKTEKTREKIHFLSALKFQLQPKPF